MSDFATDAVEKALDQLRPGLPEVNVHTELVVPNRFRKLRIAWSMFWGLACVLLIVLWVRSYSHDDILVNKSSRLHIFLESDQGRLTTYWQRTSAFKLQYPIDDYDIPYWFPVLMSIAFAAAPWLRELKLRFTLRTLLIATTLVAVVLGLAVYAAR